MRITDVRTYIPMVGIRPQCLVRISTDAGIVGWGESGLSAREEAVAAAVGHYRDLLIGADPMARGAIWQRLYRSQYFEGGRVLTAAQSAIDIALYDICGKALGVPVYELLGGKQRDFVPLFATAGAPMGPALLDDVRGLVAEGWQAIRLFPSMPGAAGVPDGAGAPSAISYAPADGAAAEDPDLFEPREALAVTAEWTTRVREAVGPGVTLGIDWHHRLSIAEAASYCQRMPPATLDFLEEPIRAESPDAYAQLRTLTDVPFAIGEEFSSKWSFLPFIERGLTDFVRVDVCNVGGFTEAMKVAGWAEAHYLDLMPHNPLGPICTAATGHLCTAVPNVSWMEIRRSATEDLGFYDRELFPVQVTLDGPRLILSDAPGLGVEVDESRLEAVVAGHWHPQQLHRRDGSVQNW
jgi:galactonate dehydratase